MIDCTVEWDGQKLMVSLPKSVVRQLLNDPGHTKNGKMTFSVEPKTMLRVKVRRVGGEWSLTFETPFTRSALLTGFDSHADYEVSMEELNLETGETKTVAGTMEPVNLNRVPRQSRVTIVPDA